jgi:MFS family permease
LGLLLASGAMALMAVVAPGDAFLEWGWRIPFLSSVALIVIGHYIRRRVEESPVFLQVAHRRQQTQTPVVQLFRAHARLVLIAALVFAGNSAAGYMTTGGYVQNYATRPDGPLHLDRGPVLLAVAGSALTWLVFTAIAGGLSDRIGRRRTCLVGWTVQLIAVVCLFPLINSGNIGLLFLALAFLTVGLGFTYGPQAAMYAELFPASIRFSGVSISYALGAIIGGAFAPTIAALLVRATGTTASVTAYLALMTLVGLVATLRLRDRSRIPLGPDQEIGLAPVLSTTNTKG